MKKELVCATPKNVDSFTLLSSAVGPGFEFKDFKLIPQSELLIKFPQHHEIIQEFTREHPHPNSSLKN